jgi:hypothetical protein
MQPHVPPSAQGAAPAIATAAVEAIDIRKSLPLGRDRVDI